MNKNLKLSIILTMILAVVVVWTGFAQQKSDETAIDPVCKMSVKIADAKIKADYKGSTYYFCAEGCRAAFLKDPEKFLQSKDRPCSGHKMPQMEMKNQEKSAGDCAAAGCQKMHGRAAMAGCGKMMECRGAEAGASPMPPAMPHGRPMCCGMMMHCPKAAHPMGMMGQQGGFGPGLRMLHDAEFAVENTKDGVIVKITSKDAEAVKKIQEMLAKRLEMRKAMAEKAAGAHNCGECPHGAKKAEAPVKPEAPRSPEQPKK